MELSVPPALFSLAQAAAPGTPKPLELGKQLIDGALSAGTLPQILLWLAIGIASWVLASWISAKVVVGDPKGSLGNAFKVWLLLVVLFFAFGLIMGVLLPVVVRTNNATAVFGTMAGSLLLMIALLFLIPMKVFSVGFFRALGYLVLTFVLSLAAQAAVLRSQGKPVFAQYAPLIEGARSATNRAGALNPFAAKEVSPLDADLDRLAQADERKKPFPERQDNLRKVYDALEAQQKTLPVGDPKAVAEYERLRAKYEELVRVLKADYAASKSSATPSPAP